MSTEKSVSREIESDLIKPPGFLGLRMDRQKVIRAFFSTCATVTIITLVLIMWSLISEGPIKVGKAFGFLPYPTLKGGFLDTYRHELSVYRKAGLEFCDHVQKPLTEHEELLSRLKRALGADLNTVSKPSRDRRDAALLAKTHVEEKAALQREALEEALEKTEPATPPEKIAELRKSVTDATHIAVATETISDIFNKEEKEKLIAELNSLQPDQEDFPPFIQSLLAESAKKDAEAKEKFAAFVSAVDEFEAASEPVVEVHDSMKELALATKEKAVQQHMAEDARTQLLEAAATAKTPEQKAAFEKDAAETDTTEIDYKSAIEPIVAKLPDYEKLVQPYIEAIKKASAALPAKPETKEAHDLMEHFRKDFPKHLKTVEASVPRMKEWSWEKPVPMTQALTSFLFGGDWITNSSWQDFYGVLPLLTGSLVIALTALVIALPFSVGAAIYVNQFASLREQEIVKPLIEFIQAIPSVVLGFIGISVLGDLIKSTSGIPWLSWIPGFPVQERLNMFNAGVLLALMAIPTMFSLAEDAINNVPRAFSEASEALGATKLQTVFRVIVPASISGILAAMLLGLGRIVGETMVVLLVAGNRIAIPDFSDGIGTVFQPAHTLTGIIAQELGEVSRGSSHWQALFMVGILLFIISLFINWASRLVVKKFQLPKI
ncbi:phosphate ABC transporter permease protein PstC [Roseimicrobium gellanilyticum]|uniref:Phosphate transport system permease protein n=1 Tax=Roseimicrobium gellanilyticum TaxID=748857 RepID=A0A366HUQ7_9BACT|nr:phosphate ABC transporter permease subunit PstC [Roseimicrobium gellanilyticum]RBP47235.1 phosphate ABC transporter permease protein PstC [Roseimicrobium gellanilyticum]